MTHWCQRIIAPLWQQELHVACLQKIYSILTLWSWHHALSKPSEPTRSRSRYRLCSGCEGDSWQCWNLELARCMSLITTDMRHLQSCTTDWEYYPTGPCLFMYAEHTVKLEVICVCVNNPTLGFKEHILLPAWGTSGPAGAEELLHTWSSQGILPTWCKFGGASELCTCPASSLFLWVDGNLSFGRGFCRSDSSEHHFQAFGHHHLQSSSKSPQYASAILKWIILNNSNISMKQLVTLLKNSFPMQPTKHYTSGNTVHVFLWSISSQIVL